MANEATNFSATTETSAVGVYAFPVLAVGSYTLHVNVSGFAPYERTGIQVRAAEVTGVTAGLAVAGGLHAGAGCLRRGCAADRKLATGQRV